MQGTTGATGGGGGGTTGGGGGVPACPAIEMFVAEGRQVGDIVLGDMLDCTTGAFHVQHVGISEQPCVRIWTDAGHELIVSVSTPFDLQDGSSRIAHAMDGQLVLTDCGHGTERVWTACHVESAGRRLVNFISVGGRTFAAGTTATRRIFSHNYLKFSV
jgi:hypothetical protein